MKRKVFLCLTMAALCSMSVFGQSSTTKYKDSATGLYFTLATSKATGTYQVAAIVPDIESSSIGKESLVSEPYKGMVNLVIPATVSDGTKNYRVVGIGPKAFQGNTTLKKVTLAEDVMVLLGNYAFAGCTALEEVDFTTKFSKDVTTQLQRSFVTSFWKEFTLGSGKTEIVLPIIGNYAFRNCSSLKKIKVSQFSNEIGEEAFSGCSALKSFYPDDASAITAYGDNAFANCTSLESFYVGEKVTKLGKNMFSGCANLSYVEWWAKSMPDFTAPDGTQPSPFYDLRENESLEIENLGEMKRVPAYLAYGVKNLYGVIPAKEIGAHAFDGCVNTWGNILGLEEVEKIEEGAINGPMYDRVLLPQTPPEITDKNVFSAGMVLGETQFYVASPNQCDANQLYKTAAGWTEINVEAIGDKTKVEAEAVILNNPYTEGNKGANSSTPRFTRQPSCDNPKFTAFLPDDAKAVLTKQGEPELVAYFSHYEYNGVRYTDRTVSIEQVNSTEILKVVYVYDPNADAVDEVKDNATRYRKVIRNGQLYILRDGKTYNALGAEVK
ncbi:MAG: leucine-rich repeat domain-containing protein [Paludibacteraceae bacterium]|nr:leucine-rich repeat domain-containing protein [Paludibacteraceae bacterium]